MPKWDVTMGVIIEADTRPEAWRLAQQLFGGLARIADLVIIQQVSMEPVDDPDDWIAVNQQNKP